MAITPTSTKSKNYQALGIDEVANDIETAFNSINSLETTVNNLPEAPTTTTVNISSAQILAMNSTPIELLPAPGVNKYYDIEKIILEYTHVTTAYTFTDFIVLYDDRGYLNSVKGDLITTSANGVAFVSNFASTADSTQTLYNTSNSFNVNSPIAMSTWISDPTLGDGTLRAIITYTTRTFGA